MTIPTKEQSIAPERSFKQLGIDPKILGVLERSGFVVPTPIQEKVIPVGLSGKDIIGIAQTGTGKTLAFGIPLVEQLLQKPGRALVVLPTRELALQVEETLRKIGAPVGLTGVVLIGGDSMHRQIQNLRRNPRIIIATPGRLIDHLKQRTVSLAEVSLLVLDEADHMFDIGFAPQIKEIMRSIPKDRQTLLFSATMPKEIAELAMAHMQLPLRIEVAPAGSTAATVEQEIIVVEKSAKFNLLVKILGEYPKDQVIVFTRTKHGAKNVTRSLRNIGIAAAEIHSNRSLGQRREALNGFKSGTYRVLAATDIAARGIDVKNIALVINYDLPDQSEDYVHRIGRTGRAGKSGKAISFATPDQKRDILDIERLIKKTLPSKSHDGATMSAHGVSHARKDFRGGRKFHGTHGHRSGGRGFSPRGQGHGNHRGGNRRRFEGRGNASSR